MHKQESVLENETHKILWEFLIQTVEHEGDNYTNCHLVDFAILADHRVKIKESEKIHKYLDLTRELKKNWNMRVTMMLIVVGKFGMTPKAWKKGWKN